MGEKWKRSEEMGVLVMMPSDIDIRGPPGCHEHQERREEPEETGQGVCLTSLEVW